MGLMSYADVVEALKPKKVSVRTIKRWCSLKTPMAKRLRAVRRNGRVTGVRQNDLNFFLEANAS